MDEPDLGRLIWADFDDPQGRPAGEHPAIILTTKAEFAAGKPIKVVVISSKLQGIAASDMVMMPSAPGGHPQTGFSKKCAAIGKWRQVVEEDDIRKYGSRIYGSLLQEVIECVKRCP